MVMIVTGYWPTMATKYSLCQGYGSFGVTGKLQRLE